MAERRSDRTVGMLRVAVGFVRDRETSPDNASKLSISTRVRLSVELWLGYGAWTFFLKKNKPAQWSFFIDLAAACHFLP